MPSSRGPPCSAADVAAVAREAGLQPLLQHDRQRLVQGVEHVDRGGVVVERAPRPSTRDHREVEVPALHLRLARVAASRRARRERDRRQARRAGEALLRPAVRRVDAPAVDLHAARRRGGHAVEQEQRAASWRSSPSPSTRLVGAGRGLGVDDRDDLGLTAGGVDHAAPARRPGPTAPRPSRRSAPHRAATSDHARAEHAVDADEHLVARLDEVDERRLHAGRAGAADGERDLFFVRNTARSLPCISSMMLEEHGVEVAEERRRHGAQDAGRTVLGPGPRSRREEGFSSGTGAAAMEPPGSEGGAAIILNGRARQHPPKRDRLRGAP